MSQELAAWSAPELMRPRTAELGLRVVRDGVVNAVVFWHELDMHGDGTLVLRTPPGPRRSFLCFF